MEKTLLEWKPFNDRLLKARFNSKFAKLTVIACYAPTENAEEEIKDEFYDQLEEEIWTTPRHDVLMVVGDLNARVGEENTGRERAMGTEGFGCINNNGKRLSDLCVENNLVIGGTLFKHRNIHKTTWRSPDNNSILQEEQELNIDSFNQALMETSKTLLGYRRKKKEEWIKSDTWTTIDERKATKKKLNDAKSQRMKEQLQSKYSELDKEVKRKTRADKRAFIENLADEAEVAAQTQNMAMLYKITKTLTGGFKNSDVPVKDVDGNVVTCEAKQTQRWKTHFETILNKEAPRNQAEIPENKENLKVNTDPPSAEGVRKAIRTMKSGKAPGADCVSAEMLKATMGALTEIFEGIWEMEETPGDWKMGLIVKLPKKGDLSLCKNWRGITLLSITSKVFSRVILDRISEALDPLLCKEQAGFRKIL